MLYIDLTDPAYDSFTYVEPFFDQFIRLNNSYINTGKILIPGLFHYLLEPSG